MDWVISSSILIILMLILRQLFGQKISCRLQYALWGLVMIRLLCPIGLWDGNLTIGKAVSQAEIQLQSIIEHSDLRTDINIQKPYTVLSNHSEANQPSLQETEQTRPSLQQESQLTAASTDTEQSGTVISAPDQKDHISDSERGTSIPSWNLVINQNQEQPDETAGIETKVWQTIKQILISVWLTGSVLGLLWIVIVNTTFSRKLKRHRIQIETDKHYRHIKVYETDAVQSPCLFGIWKPAVYMTPQSREDSDEFSMVLEHEFCHYHHMDQIWVLMRGVCLAVWWWNPLVWIAVQTVKRDCELACDEAVLHRIGRENRIRYGEILVKITERKSVRHPDYLVASTMASGNKDMKGRLRMIIQGTRRNMISMIAVVIMMICCTVFCLGGESATSKQAEPLPLLAAAETYEHVLTKDGVDEFVKEAGLLSDTNIWQITPEFMKGSGVELYQDTYNKRYYVQYQKTVAELKIPSEPYSVPETFSLLSSALADLDNNSIYELYYTGIEEWHNSDDNYFRGVVVKVDLAEMKSYLNTYSSSNGEKNARQLIGIDEDGIFCIFRGKLEYTDNEELEFILNYGKKETAVSELHFGEQIPSSEPDTNNFAHLRSGANLILAQDIWQPPFGLMWGDSLNEVTAVMSETEWTEIVSETETKLIYENQKLFGLETDMTAFVDQELGLIRVDFVFAPQDIEDAEQALRYSLGEGRVLTDKTTGSVGICWDSVVPEQLNLYGQQLYQQIESDNDYITEGYRQLPLVTTALYKDNNVFKNGSPGTCSFQAAPTAALICSSLKPELTERVVQSGKQWFEQYDTEQPELIGIHIVEQRIDNWNTDSLQLMHTEIPLDLSITKQMWQFAQSILDSGKPLIAVRTAADLTNLSEYRQLIFELDNGTSVIILCSEDQGGILVLADAINEITADMHMFRISQNEASDVYTLTRTYFDLEDADEMKPFAYEGWIGWPELEIVLPEAQIPLFGDLLWGDTEDEILRKLIGYNYTRREENGTILLTFDGMVISGRNAQVRTVISQEHGLEDVYVIWAGYDWNLLLPRMIKSFGENSSIELDGISIDMSELHTVASEYSLNSMREITLVTPGEGMIPETLNETAYWNHFIPSQLPREIRNVYKSLHGESDPSMSQPLMDVTMAYYKDEETNNTIVIRRHRASLEFIQACLEYAKIQQQMISQMAVELQKIYPETAVCWFGLTLDGSYDLKEYDKFWNETLNIFAHTSDVDRGLASYGLDTAAVMPDYETEITILFRLDESTMLYAVLYPDGTCSGIGIQQQKKLRYLDLLPMGTSQPQRESRSMLLWTGMPITDEDMAADFYDELLEIWIQSGRTSEYFTITKRNFSLDHLAVTNMTQEEAIAFVEDQGLNYEIDTESNQWVEPGRAIRLGHTENLKLGDTVTIYICNGMPE